MTLVSIRLLNDHCQPWQMEQVNVARGRIVRPRQSRFKTPHHQPMNRIRTKRAKTTVKFRTLRAGPFLAPFAWPGRVLVRNGEWFAPGTMILSQLRVMPKATLHNYIPSHPSRQVLAPSQKGFRDLRYLTLMWKLLRQGWSTTKL